MKKILFSIAVLGFIAFSSSAFAQDEKAQDEKLRDEKKMQELINQKEKERKRQSQEIIIRTKTDKNTKITVEVNGDKVTINGKPLSEFKDDNVTINKKNITVWDGKGLKELEMFPQAFANGFSFSTDDDKPHGFLGVTTATNEDGADNKKVPGALITNITDQSAAEKAGLKVGDIITKIDDKIIDNPDDLTEVIGDKKPKDEVTVYFKRDGKENSAKAILGQRKTSMAYSFTTPQSYDRSYAMPRAQALPRMRSTEDWSEELTPGIFTTPGYDLKNNLFGEMYPRHQKLGLKIQDTEEGNGVKVLDVDKDSPAEKAGLKKDDIVIEVGGKKVSNTDEARDQLQENAEKSTYTIKAKRNGTEMNFDIRIPKKLKTANL